MSYSRCLIFCAMWSTALCADVAPKALLKALESEDFAVRESAQSDLLLWARKNPKGSVSELLRLSSEAGSPSPEVRERCMQVLRQLAADDFAKEGDGYLGVRMEDRLMRIPGESAERWAVVVLEVVADSAAAKCGLKIGDAIVELDGQVWNQQASMLFSEQIRKRKPGTRVRLRIVRDGVLQSIRGELARRPAEADLFMPGTDPEEGKALEQKARDTHFQRWLSEKRGAR